MTHVVVCFSTAGGHLFRSLWVSVGFKGQNLNENLVERKITRVHNSYRFDGKHDK
jgi:hypothetical protein